MENKKLIESLKSVVKKLNSAYEADIDEILGVVEDGLDELEDIIEALELDEEV